MWMVVLLLLEILRFAQNDCILQAGGAERDPGGAQPDS